MSRIVFFVSLTMLTITVRGFAADFSCSNFDDCIDDFEVFVRESGDAVPDSGDLHITNTLGEGGGGTVALVPEFAGDVSILTRARVLSGGVGLEIRNSGGGNKVVVSASDQFGLLLSSIVDGIGFLHPSVDVGAVEDIGTDIWMQFESVGNSYKVWYWHDGDEKPEPQISITIPDEQIPSELGSPSVWAFGKNTVDGERIEGETIVRELHISTIPEPSSLGLMITSLGLFLLGRHRDKAGRN